ncbi:hypothetical protein RI129_000244 [Pyrocoelia pectoralis]|uniref:acid phosphatase n=1 Tax=Pyrocoelia pectoralis TaxID=417401 RepID=A0AAN7VJU6_9COLE
MIKYTIFVFVILCLYTILISIESYKTHDSLKLLHVLFRHGDRTPVKFRYPTDPYKKEKYDPYGFSQLTNTGKQRAYNLGKWLRRRYDFFLNRTYSTKELSAYTTNTSRSKASLSLVLAGLYPPKGTALEWDMQLNWNPINYEIISETNQLLMIPTPKCQELLNLLSSYLNTNEGQGIMKKYDDIKDILSNNTQLSFDNPFRYLMVYDLVTVQEEQGLGAPKWIEPILPKMSNILNDIFQMFTATKEIRQFTIGKLLEKIAGDSLLKVNNSPKLRHKKLFMYSAHDFNVGMFLKVINPSVDHGRPTYSACIMVEIHSINGVHGLKVFYQPDVTQRRRSITIDNCGKFCPLNKFITLFNENFPGTKNQC